MWVPTSQLFPNLKSNLPKSLTHFETLFFGVVLVLNRKMTSIIFLCDHLRFRNWVRFTNWVRRRQESEEKVHLFIVLLDFSERS